MKANVELHIDELILDGLPFAQRDRIAAAVEAELQRLLEEGGLPEPLAGGGTLFEVQVGDLPLASGIRPSAVGAQIAGTIYSHIAGNWPKSGLPERSTR
jgi:hypothetical protein